MKTKPTYQELEKEIEILRQKLTISESEDKFKSFFENNKAVMLQLDTETKQIINANKTAIDFYGYPKDKLLQKTINDLNTLSPNEISRLMQKAVKNKSNFFQFKHKLASGKIKDVEVYSSPFKVSKKVQMFVTIYDITDRKNAEQALKESETKYKKLSKQFRLMSNNIPDLVWAKDLEGKYIFVNKAICEKLLIAKDTKEPIGKTDMFFATQQRNLYPDKKDWHTFGEICVNSDEVVIKSKKPQRFDEYGNVNGEFLFLDVYKAPIFDDDDKMIGTVGHGRIVTREKEIEKALKESEKSLAMAQEIANIGSWDWNIKDNTIKLSDKTYRQFGLKPRELAPSIELFEGFVHPDNLDFWKENVNDALSGKKKYSFEVRMINQDGRHWIMHAQGIVYRNHNDEPIRILGTQQDITENKLADESLRESEERFSKFMDYLPAVVFIKDAESRTLFVNKYMKDKLGAKDWIGKTPLELFPKEIAGQMTEDDKIALSKGYQKTIETVPHENGTEHIYETRKFAIKRAGKESLLGGIAIDITEKIQAEEKIQQQQKLLENTIESLTHPFYVVDVKNYKVILANSAAKKLSNSLENITCYELTHKTNKPCIGTEHPCPLIEIKKNKKAVMVEHIHYSKDGNTRNVEIHAYPILDNKGNVVHMIEYTLDITDRKKVEQALKESEERYKAIFEESYSIMLIINPENGQIVDANKTACDFYGYLINEITQMNIKQINTLSEEEVQLEMQNAKNAKRNKFFFKHKLANGKLKDVEVYSGRILLKGKPLLYSIIHDISDRIRAEHQIQKQNIELKELNATKDKFFSIIAHDLKSPFNTMLGFSQLLVNKFDLYDLQKQKKFLGILNQDIQNTFKLLENLLLWTRSQRGKIDFVPEKLNLYLLATETTDLSSQTATEKTIRLVNEIAENIFVKADKNMLASIFRNLISNAIKFTPKGGEIGINARSIIDENKQNYMEISIKDSGIGISKDKQAQLFRISENISIKGTEGETGTGLGLILCKEFVEKHGGQIWVKSEVGKGSKFIFTIPVV